MKLAMKTLQILNVLHEDIADFTKPISDKLVIRFILIIKRFNVVENFNNLRHSFSGCCP